MVFRARHQFFGNRITLLLLFVALCLLLLIARLWYLQCFNGAYYRDLSENNRTRTVRTVAARGTVYDRDDRILVTSRPSFDIGLILEDIPKLELLLGELGSIVGREPSELKKRLSSQRTRKHFEPKIVLEDVPWEVLARLKANSYRLPGVIIDVLPTRLYTSGSLGSQLFGYVREISRAQLERQVGKEYRPGDIIGQSGLERTWEEALRGKSGFRQVEVDAMGNRKGELGIVDDKPGRDLFLTIDRDLQEAAERALAGRRGAAVVLDPRNGEVLALASTPTFDPNLFAAQMDSEDWQRLIQDKNEPLTNRALGQVYPAGSTFKLVTTVAALADQKFSPDSPVNCPGYFQFGGRKYQCHKRGGHGLVTMREALAHSCNAYYFQLGNILGIERIERYATLLGLGAKSGIELPGEVSGIVPSDRWKRETRGEKWYPGDTLPVSIGQGYLVVSPLQMAVVASAIANDGVIYKPNLVRKIRNPVTGEEEVFPPTVVRRLEVPRDVFRSVREFSSEVVRSGTGKSAGFKHISVGGKTGTAQVSVLGREKLHERLGDHAWFIGYAPIEEPQIALSVIVENGGHGGVVAAPVSKQIMWEFFRKQGMIRPDEERSPESESALNEAGGDHGEGVGDEASNEESSSQSVIDLGREG